MWNVRPGDKVALTRKLKRDPNNSAITLPELNVVYTVRDACMGYNPEAGFMPSIRLVEIVNPVQRLTSGPGEVTYDEVKFTLRCFRPVQYTKGMETLRAALNNPKLITETNPLDVRKVKVG